MPKDKNLANGSLNHLNRIKRYNDYFDAEKTYFMTPHSRSLPKKKIFFKNRSSIRQSSKKPGNRRRESIHNVKKAQRNQNSPPSNQKISRYDRSIGRQYDSPSRDNEDLDFFFAEQINRKKAGNQIERTIDQVYEELTKNNLQKAISLLNQAMTTQPNNYDINYLLGVCHLLNGQYNEAISIFDFLLSKKPKKNIYLLLSVCYKKIQDYDQTEKIVSFTIFQLNQCLKKHPKSFETHIYRGKLYLKLKRYADALSDFEKAIKTNPEKQIAFIGKGDCLRLTQNYDQAKGIYVKALHLSKKANPSIFLRKAICNMELKRFELAFDDISQILKIDPQNSEALYFKGLLLSKQKSQNQAIICYQQAIKFNTNKKAVTRSIYELAKIKIQHRDYYEALYTLERANFLDIQERVIRKFKIFADGATQLMKKNFESGIKILNELMEQNAEKPIGNFLKPLVYSCLAYGYMSLCKYQQAKQQLQKLESEFCLDIPNLYNKFICEGITACNSQRYEQALSFFSKAGKIMPSKIEPYFYKATTLICFISKLIPRELKQKQKEYLQSAMKTINKCQRQIQNNASLFLVKSFLNYALGFPEEAIEDLDKCMSDSTKHLPIHYYLHGMILAQYYGKYEQAIEQFKKALNSESDHKIPQIYLNKAKCLLLLGEINSGFVDLQTYMSYKYSSPEIHVWAGHLLFYINATQDAAKAYSNINNINQNTDVLLYRAKCYLNSKNVLDTLVNLKLILDTKYDNKVYFDYHVLDALRQCSEEEHQCDYSAILAKIKEAKQRAFTTGEGKFGYFVREAEYEFYEGVLYFYMQNYSDALKNFQRALKLTEDQIKQKAEQNSEYLQFYKLSYNNIPFNYIECLFNMAICELKLQSIPKCIKKIKLAIEKCPESETKGQLETFLTFLEKQLRNQFNREREMPNGNQYSQLNPFPSQNRLCSIFPQFQIPLSTPIQTRLYFCLPGVQKPDISPKFDQKLYDEINMATIEIKPQAPWIKRSDDGVIFTDDVVGYDVELSVSSEEENSGDGHEEEEYDLDLDRGHGHNDQEEDEEEEEEEEGEDEDDFLSEEQEKRQKPMKPEDLKKMFQLDPQVQAKLAKLR